jgi:hypothetical protein
MIKDDWSGGYFEVEMHLGKISAQSAKRFAEDIWQYPFLDGPFHNRTLDDKTTPIHFDEEWGGAAYGNASIAGNGKGNAVCVNSMIHYIEDDHWICIFGIPMSSLSRIYPVGAYPFEDGTSTDWISPASDWLIELTRYASTILPIDKAFIGWDIDHLNEDGSLSDNQFPDDIPSNIRWYGYLKRTGTELVWFPPTENKAPMTIQPKWRWKWKIWLQKWLKK